MSNRIISVHRACVDVIEYFDFDGTTLLQGKSDFTTLVLKDGVKVTSPTPIINELGVAPNPVDATLRGLYKFALTPDSKGNWFVRVVLGTTGRVWTLGLEVTGESIATVVYEGTVSENSGSGTSFKDTNAGSVGNLYKGCVAVVMTGSTLRYIGQVIAYSESNTTFTVNPAAPGSYTFMQNDTFYLLSNLVAAVTGQVFRSPGGPT